MTTRRQSASSATRTARVSVSPGSKSLSHLSPKRDALKPVAEHDETESNAQDTIRATQSLLATLETPSSSAQSSLGLHMLREKLAQYAASEQQPIVDEGLRLDWELYNDVGGALEQEEALLLDYFRKLKFIYLEQETKLRFLADLQDDPETGQEPQILSAADVAQREHDCRRVKQQLVEAKRRVRDLREEIDELAAALAEPWAALEDGAREAKQLISEISDMELELARSKAAEGTQGAMTTAEAEALCDEQIVEMQTFDDDTTHKTREMEQCKRELAESLRHLERLKVERSAAEKLANEAQLGAGRDRGRDWEMERVCARHQSMLDHLHETLALQALRAPSAHELELVLAPHGTTLRLAFDEPGGALVQYAVEDAHGEAIDLSKDTLAFADAALASNLPAALAQRIWQEV